MLRQVNFETNFGKFVTNDKFIITYFDREKKIVALNPENLERVWEYKFNEKHYSVGKKIFVYDNKIYFATKSNIDYSGIYCLNADNGKLIWEKPIIGHIEYINKLDEIIYGYTEKKILFKISLNNPEPIISQLEYQPVSNIEKINKHLYYYAKEGFIKYDLNKNKEEIIIPYDGIEGYSRLDSQIMFVNYD